jgi:hypothetical protein
MIKNFYEKEQENNMVVDALRHTSEIITVLTQKIESLENNNLILNTNIETLYNELLKLKPGGKINIINKIDNQKLEKEEKEENINIFIQNQNDNLENKKEINTDKKNKIIRDILNYKKNKEIKIDLINSNNSSNSTLKEKNILKENNDIDMFSEKRIQNSLRRKKNSLFSKY